MPESPSSPKPHHRGAGLSPGPSKEGCRINGRLWVERDGETFLAWGRVVLLERIREHGSISKAARSMGMGYRHAWSLVDRMNAKSPKLLVRKVIGGKDGGGSTLTPEGEVVIRTFWGLVDDYREWMSTRDPRLWRGEDRGRKKRRGRK